MEQSKAGYREMVGKHHFRDLRSDSMSLGWQMGRYREKCWLEGIVNDQALLRWKPKEGNGKKLRSFEERNRQN